MTYAERAYADHLADPVVFCSCGQRLDTDRPDDAWRSPAHRARHPAGWLWWWPELVFTREELDTAPS